jgi:membrane metallo-endopeptidase-like protein 1
MVDQYSKYSAFGENLKGKQTLGENIADNGGLKSAFNAYEDLVRSSGEEPALPGLKYTHRQLFFLAFAQVWCTNSRAEDNHMSILTDPHSLPRYRVIGPISNSREFAEQFSCPKNSLMNPTTKCEVW